MTLQTVGIVGAGAWGTALAIVARRAGRDVLLWAHEPETVADINQRHRNETFLPGIKLDKAIEATSALQRGRQLRRVADGDAGAASPRHRRRACPLPARRAAARALLEGHRAGDRQADVASHRRGAARGRGRRPRDLDALLALPGIGAYTARAVLVFAFEDEVGLVETNIAAGALVGRAGGCHRASCSARPTRSCPLVGRGSGTSA